MIGRVLARTENPVAIAGHLATGDVGDGRPDPWTLSADRAQLSRALLVAAGVTDARLARVSGKADRSPSTETADDERNRRIEITLLRRFAP
jgi:chemotaxis protein MotB